MKTKPGKYKVVLAIAALELASACGAPTTPAQSDHALVEKTAEAQSDLLKATADANYKVAMQQASNDAAKALKQCDDTLTGDLQKGCKDRATANYTTAQARADADRNTNAQTN